MAEKGGSKRPGGGLAAVVLLAAVAVGGGVYLARQAGDPFRTAEPLDVEVYLRDANGLRGNVYKVKGEVGEQLAWRADGSRLIAVRVTGGGGPGREGEMVPLLLPAKLREAQVQRGQVFFFRVEVGEGGVMRVLDMVKA